MRWMKTVLFRFLAFLPYFVAAYILVLGVTPVFNFVMSIVSKIQAKTSGQ